VLFQSGNQPWGVFVGTGNNRSYVDGHVIGMIKLTVSLGLN
jgi:hypothetical protein